MATLDGGWTLVYRYSIQDLKSGNSTIFPVPDWLKDDKDDNTKISKKAPQGTWPKYVLALIIHCDR